MDAGQHEPGEPMARLELQGGLQPLDRLAAQLPLLHQVRSRQETLAASVGPSHECRDIPRIPAERRAEQAIRLPACGRCVCRPARTGERRAFGQERGATLGGGGLGARLSLPRHRGERQEHGRRRSATLSQRYVSTGNILFPARIARGGGDRRAPGPLGFRQVAFAYVGFAHDNPAEYRVMFCAEVAPTDDCRDSRRLRAACGIRGWPPACPAGCRPGRPWRPRMMAHAVWASLHGRVMLSLDGETAAIAPSVDAMVEQSTKMIRVGLAPRDAPGSEPRA
jgi:hypothetical protein